MDITHQHQVETLNRQAVAMARSGQSPLAEQLWSQALQLDPDAIPIRANLARLFFQAGRYAEVLNLCQHLRPSSTCPAALAALIGQSAIRLSKPAFALPWLSVANHLRPNEPSLQLPLSESLLACGHVQHATALLELLVQRHPAALEPQLNLALALTESGFISRAAACYSKLLSHWPTHTAVLMNAARFHLDYGDQNVARSIVDDLLQQEPRSRYARKLLAEYHRNNGDSQQSHALWLSLLAENSCDIEAHLPLIFTAMDRRDWHEATERLQNAFACCDGPVPSRLLAAWADLPPSHRQTAFPQWTLDYATVIHQQQLLQPDDPLLSQWINWLKAEPSLIENRPGKPTVGGLQSHELLNRVDHQLSQTLLSFLIPAVEFYCDHHLATPSFWMDLRRSSSPHYSGWGVVLRPGGQQLRHTHPEARISGVLYLSTPPEMPDNGSDQGSLWFSPNPLWQEAAYGFTVNPKPGLLVLFPSFLPHETVPFVANGDRICVAFNVN